jgi:hypothetical protein
MDGRRRVCANAATDAATTSGNAKRMVMDLQGRLKAAATSRAR